MNDFFKSGTVPIGGKQIPFEKRAIRGNFHLNIPCDFCEDKNIVSNYSYLFSRDKSPLSIAIKYSPTTAQPDCTKMIAHYFAVTPDTLCSVEHIENAGIYYRENVAQSCALNVYSLRFVVEHPKGTLFGCFNCDAAYKDDWKPVILQMLQNIEEI